MRINKLLKISAMMAFLFAVNHPVYSLSYSKEAYDEYVSAYQNYQEAINGNKSAEDVQAALAAYNEAKVKYQALINNNSDASSDNTFTAASAATASVNIENEAELNSLGIPNNTPKTPVVSEISDLQRSYDDMAKKFSKKSRRLIDELREIYDKDKAQKLIEELEKEIESEPNKDNAELMKYEVASALDRLSINPSKAKKMLNELSNSINYRIANYARLNLNWIEAKTKKKDWQNSLASQEKELNSTKEKFKDTKWLAFPVKITRGISSVVSNAKFTSNKSDYEKYMLEYEAIQAYFVTNVNAVFNEWQAGIKDPEEAAEIRLVYDNYDAWYARWNLLNNAKSSIDVQYFIIENDVFGRSLLGTLQKKAQEGVKVRLMVDTRGSNKMSTYMRGYLIELAKNNNIEVHVYNPITSNVLSVFTDVRKMESSNHDKILIVDGEKCVMGGRNIANTYLVTEEDMDDAWRDCDVVINSEKICEQLKLAFDEEFESMKAYDAENNLIGTITGGYTNKMVAAYNCMNIYLSNHVLFSAKSTNKTYQSMIKTMNEELQKYVHMTGYNNFKLMDNSHTVAAHVLDNNSITGDRKDITENIVKYIDASRTEIYIQNPYFALTDRADAALHRAAKRGVPIYIHSNSERSSDSAPTEAVVLRDWKKMLTEMPTMRFFARNSDGQLHGKTFAFDGKVCVIGSYNFDALSEKVNSEVCVAIKSPEFTAELRNCIMEDIEKALEYHLATDTEDEFGPGDVEGAKNKLLTKVLTHFKFLQPLF